MAENIKYRFIENVGDFFPTDYFGEDFLEKVQKCADYSGDQVKELSSKYPTLRQPYDSYKNFIVNQNPRTEDAIERTHEWHTRVLDTLGYPTAAPYTEYLTLGEAEDKIETVPVRHILRKNNKVQMLIMEMQPLIKIGDAEPAGLFEQRYQDEEQPEQKIRHQQYYVGQWKRVFTFDLEHYRVCPAVINKAVSRIFLLEEEQRPQYILLMAGNKLMLLDQDKWARGSYLILDFDELFSQASISAFRNYYALFHLLCCRETLAADTETPIMARLMEDSYKNAHDVTGELKKGVVTAVEEIANEALHYWKETDTLPISDYTDDTFEAEVKDDCLTMVYRLLFIFYAESRTELEILPTGDEVYNKGYSLEMLRDLEQTRLTTEESKSGYYFDDSIKTLFRLLSGGHKEDGELNKQFRVKHIDSPMFDDRKLHHLSGVRLRNSVWQKIIQSLSLSRRNGRTGRISYANLGVNQLGSVYESLLAYRGFYAEEDYIEVHKAGEPQDGTFLVPYSRFSDFEQNEILSDENGMPVILPQGTFVYRLNGRDRQKSASYYTPEVLTRSTVKYTLKGILEKIDANLDEYRKLKDAGLTPSDEGWKSGALELLNLKILEPAMGAAAFQNEVINQVAEAFLEYRSKELRLMGWENWRVDPNHYQDELQKIKAYIATHNVYGVDLNPTAIELGKLSLWLNVIHKDMETPFFSNRLAVGNAVIGAWLRVYDKKQVIGVAERGHKLTPTPWWEKAPVRVHFSGSRIQRKQNEIYHFLLPDKNMLGVRSIKEQKQANPDAYKRMSGRIKDWTAAIGEEDFKRLQRLSKKIDVLLNEYFKFQYSIDQLTQNRYSLWGTPNRKAGEQMSLMDEVNFIDTYREKQLLNDTRYRHDNAYYKLKMVMDYWCSLWFWEYDDAASLPSRDDYWSDIEAMLDISDAKVNANVESNQGEETTQQESELLAITKEQILTEVQGQNKLFEESYRFKIVARLAAQYHFFHPMLEFLEVFWLRDGFDIICGNPPWLKLEFDELGILAEKYPEVAIRKMSAPAARKLRDTMFVQIPSTEILYRLEEIDTACSSQFMNAYCNYPLLEGQQTNLYKCIIENGFTLLSDSGYMGLLHPEGIYDDPNGQPLRRLIYKRLRYHFQYQNALNLFPIGHREKYSTNVYGVASDCVSFDNINNVFHPSVVDGSYNHNGSGVCAGIKKDGGWNLDGHKSRIVHYTDKELQVLSNTFEDGNNLDSPKLVIIHSKEIMSVLESLSAFRSHIRDYETKTTVAWDEANSVNDGTICRKTCYPVVDKLELIYSGPHIFVGNPIYKTPRKICINKADYDTIDPMLIDANYNPRTNFVPCCSVSKFKSLIPGFQIGVDADGKPICDDWCDYYKVAWRKMLNQAGERTLTTAIIPPKTTHINGVVSTTFKDIFSIVECAALCSSIVLDFYVKTIGAQNLQKARIDSFPIGVEKRFASSLHVRALMLNCLTNSYSDLWNLCWNNQYSLEKWSRKDSRLKSFDSLQGTWNTSCPLRNYFERRQALVEIDVISAMALGLTLEDLEMIYNIQFPVLKENDEDTWYDQEGKIVFTCSKGLTGVGLDRPVWDQIKGKISEDGLTAEGTMPTYEHTITKSELYQGQKQTFIAPYTKCDRIADYRRAWAHFEKVFENM